MSSQGCFALENQAAQFFMVKLRLILSKLLTIDLSTSSVGRMILQSLPDKDLFNRKN
jgi:hypothetical protein